MANSSSTPTIQGSTNLYNPFNLQGPSSVSGNIKTPGYNDTGFRFYEHPGVQTATQPTELELLQEEIDRLMKQLNTQALPADIGIGNIFKKAQSQAISAETPQFKKEKQIFLNRIEQRRTESAADAEAGREALKQRLERSLEDITTGKTRTGEDVQRNINDINTAEGQFQQDEAQQFQEDRTLIADQTASAGLTTSGLGRKKVTGTEEQRNVASARALQTLEGKREVQQIFKSRTFADYDTAEKRQQADNELENKAVTRELTKELNKIAYDEITGERQLQKNFEADVADEISKRGRVLVEQALGGISDPRVKQATREAYGGYF